jgi:hypothetical protein
MRGTRWTLWSLIVGLQLVTAALAGTGCSDAANTSHEPGVVRQAECLSCHESDLKAVLSPPHDTLPTTCQDCHTESQWIPAASTAIHTPLPASCVTCHENDPQPETIFHTQVFEPECASCHRNYPGWAPADFLHAPVPGSCNECHSDLRPTTPSWTIGRSPMWLPSTHHFPRRAKPVTRASRGSPRSSTRRSSNLSARAATGAIRIGPR